MGNPVNFYGRQTGKTHFWPPNGAFTNPNIVSEDSVAMAAYNFTVTGMYVKLKDSTSGTRKFVLRKNSIDTEILTTLQTGETASYVTGSVIYSTAKFDTISIKEVEDDSPENTQYSVSLIVTAESGRQPLVFGKRISNVLNAFNYPILNDCLSNWLTEDILFPTLAQQLAYTRVFSTSGFTQNYRMLVTSVQTHTGAELIFYNANRENFNTWITLLYDSVYGENVADQLTVNTTSLLYSIGANKNITQASFALAGSTYQTLDFYPDDITSRAMGNLVSNGTGDNPRYFAGVGAGGGHTTTTAGEPFIVVPIDATIKNLYITSNSVLLGTAVDVTIRNNFADTALTATIVSASSTGSNTTYNLSVVAGDKLSIKAVSSGTLVRSINVGWLFDSGFSNVTPLFLSCNAGSATTVDGTDVPINFYSRSDTNPINFYSLP